MLWWLSVIMYLGTVHQSKLANSGRMSPAASEGVKPTVAILKLPPASSFRRKFTVLFTVICSKLA